jgi:hypothetical protein
MAPNNNSTSRTPYLVTLSVILFGLVALCCIASVALLWFKMSTQSTPSVAAKNTAPTQPVADPSSKQPAGESAAGPGPQDACLPGIYPGKTTKDEVIILLGTPVSAEEGNGFATLLYPSPLAIQNNVVYLDNQVVSLVSIVSAGDKPLTWSSVKLQYGEPAHTAYTTYLQGSRYYAYPAQGLGYVADEEMDIVYIQDCFIPMSPEDFLNSWGKSLLTEDPFVQ